MRLPHSGHRISSAVVGVPWDHGAWPLGRLGPGASRTDEAGRFEIWWVLRGAKEWYSEYAVAVLARGYALAILPFPEIERGPSRVRLDVALEPGGTVSGRVLAPDGSPIAGAGVTLLLQAEGFVRSVARRDVVVTAARDEVDVDLVLRKASRLLVRVLDGDDDPVMGAHVRIPKSTDSAVRTTDEEGRATFAALAPGGHAVRVLAEGYVPRAVPVEVEGGATNEIAVRLDEGASIAGTLEGAEGQPLERYRVQAWGMPGGVRSEVRTDAKGRFSIRGLSPARYRLQTLAPRGQAIVGLQQVVQAPARGVRLLAPRTGWLRVHPTTFDGRDPPTWMGIRFSLGEATYDLPATWSRTKDGDPLYLLEVPVGSHRFRFHADGYAPVERTVMIEAGEIPNDVYIDLGEDPEPLVVVLERGAVLRGRVATADGQGIRYADVLVRDVDAPEDESRWQWPEVDQLGAFRARVPSGRWEVGLLEGDRFVPRTEVVLESGDDVEVEIRALER